MRHALDRWFHVSARGSTFGREIAAGVTVFGAMAYIVAVNPAILASAGLDRHAMVMTTIAGTVAGTLLMALWARMPVALAPAMGSNVLFAQVVIRQGHLSAAAAFTVVLVSGLCFTALAASRVRERVIRGFPPAVVLGIQLALGAFIARVGLTAGGIAVPAAGGLAFGPLDSPSVLLALAGVALCAALTALRVPAGLLLAIAAITVAGLFVPAPGGGRITALPDHALDWPRYPAQFLAPFDFPAFLARLGETLPITLYFLISDFFDGTATMMTVFQRAGLRSGESPAFIRRAFIADGAASVIGATLGTCTVAAYVESLAGVESGGRTGLSALVVALLFALTLPFWPLLAAIPAAATAPVLIVVGLVMLAGAAAEIGRSDSLPPLLMLVLAAVTGDFMLSLTCGLLLYTALCLAARKGRELNGVVLGLDVVFLLYMALRARIGS